MSDRRKVYFYYPFNKEEAKLESLKRMAMEHDFVSTTHPDEANIIVSIGGDGAFLQAVRKTGFREDCLYTGINTSDSPSLYCDFQIDNLEHMYKAMMNKETEVRRYPTIKAKIDDRTSFYCLNECAIRSSLIKTFVIDVFIDDFHFETFRGDGMIVATPTGSTAYNKSVKGAVVDPKLQCYQVSEIASLNNNTYRTLGSSFILGEERKLTLHIVQDGNDYPLIGMDNEALSIQNIKKLEVELSGKKIKTVKLKNNSFWEKVQRQFL